MIDATSYFLMLAVSVVTGIIIGLLIGTAFANSDMIEDCMKHHDVNRCVVIAIPADKLPIYKEY